MKTLWILAFLFSVCGSLAAQEQVVRDPGADPSPPVDGTALA